MMDFISSIDWPTVVTTVAALASAVGVGAGGRALKRKYDQHQDYERELTQEGINDAVGEQWKELAQARKGRMELMQQEIDELRERVSRLEGAYEALEALKSEDIAVRVVELIRMEP